MCRFKKIIILHIHLASDADKKELANFVKILFIEFEKHEKNVLQSNSQKWNN
jgi:hypothetical protein